MSSFIDRWLYSRRNSLHNESTRNANTGAQYTRTRTLSTTPHGAPTTYLAGQTSGEVKTTPNLRNVPWSYYNKEELERTRRGSASSYKSSESETE